jgi:transcriptional regulator with PAS, ATPase and Fis domain
MGSNGKIVLGEGFPLLLNGKMSASAVVLNEISTVSRNMSLLDNASEVIKESEMQNARYSFKDIIYQSDSMKDVIATAKKAASTDVTVLLRGESGVGKELFAHAIHKASSRQKNKFLRVNCASLPESLLESILFGYAGSAFTGAKREGQIGLFEAANRGTIFLDEIGDISLSLQNKLLRVLQEREITRVGESKLRKVDVRIVFATNADLESKIVRKEFREDLYYRINVFPVQIPALRYRIDDIRVLADMFIQKYSLEYKRNIKEVEEAYYTKLQNYAWPGNARELENVIVRSLINTDSEQLILRQKSIEFLTINDSEDIGNINIGLMDKKYKELFLDWEKQMISKAYAIAGNNKSKMACNLGISVRSAYDKIKQHGL